MSVNACILIIEDDTEISLFLQTSLKSNGFLTLHASTIVGAKSLFSQHKPGLVILDLNLPDGDGRDFISHLRTYSDIPILVLSARLAEAEKVACFDLGADDYLAKPFGVNELLARNQVRPKYPPRVFPHGSERHLALLHPRTASQRLVFRLPKVGKTLTVACILEAEGHLEILPT